MRRHKPHVQVFGTLDLFGCAIHFVYFCFMPFNFYLLTRTHTHAIAHVQPVSGSFLLLSHSPLSVRFTASQSALFAFAACAPSIDLYQYPSTISLCNIPVEPIGSSNKSCIKNELNLFALIKITPTQTGTHAHPPTPIRTVRRVTNCICGNSFGLFITLFMIHVIHASGKPLKYNQKTISSSVRLAQIPCLIIASI